MNLKSVYSFAIILLLFLVVLIKGAFAQDSQMLKLELKGINTQNNAVSGSVNLVNNSNSNFAQSYLILRLISPGTSKTLTSGGQNITIQQPGQLIDTKKTDPFSLVPSQTVEQPFSLAYPAGVNSGKYTLTVEIKDQDGTSHGVTSQEVDLSGTNTFINITPADCRLKVGNNTFDATEGPNVAKNQTATLNCTIKNTTSKAIQAKPQVEYAVNSIGDASKTTLLNPSAEISFGVSQTRTVNLVLPNDLAPQVYEGMFYLVDAANQQISPQIPLRWIITGASAVIKNLDLDKSYYKAGDVAKVSAKALPSIDLSWRGSSMSANPGFSPEAGTDLKNSKINLKITNSDNQVCGQKEHSLPATKEKIYWDELNVDIPISIECKNPKVEVAVYEEGIQQPLTTMTKGVVTTNNDLYGTPITAQTAANAFKSPWFWVVIILLVSAAIGGYVFWKKRKRTPPPGSASQSPSSRSVPASAQKPDTTKPVTAAIVLLVGILGIYLFGQDKPALRLPIQSQQQFAPIQRFSESSDILSQSISKLIPQVLAADATASASPSASSVVSPTPFAGGGIQGVAKPPVNSTDAENTKTVFMQKLYYNGRSGFGSNTPPEWSTIKPLDWANVRDFAQNNTGGDSQVSISDDCSSIQVTVNGTVGSDYICANWGPGIAIANFVDGKPVTPTEATSSLGNEIVIPSLEISQHVPTPPEILAMYPDYNNPVFNDFSAYGPHIINVHSLGTVAPKSITYKLKLPTPLAPGEHKLLLQAGASLITKHAVYDRYFSTLEAVDNNIPDRIPGDTNCDGTAPCFIPLEHSFTCKPPTACNTTCSNSNDCSRGENGCRECRPNAEGQNTCQPPPQACNAACSGDRDCFGNKDGCSVCIDGACKVPPACNSSCTTDSQCTKAADGCTACVGGACKPPPACGSACTTRADCAAATKDGCVECLEGSCTNFNDNMCKCDGMVAEMNYPNPFKFEAFGKVEGGDVAKAEIADITFRMTKDNQVIAKSNPITPQVVENTGSKMRFKAAWQTAPPAVDRNGTYRVFADVRCKPKRITTADSSQTYSPVPQPVADASVKQQPPKGLELVLNGINKLFSENGQVKAATSKLLTMFSTSTVHAQGNLQLDTLNFVKLMDTDNCRFVMFKFDETLF